MKTQPLSYVLLHTEDNANLFIEENRALTSYRVPQKHGSTGIAQHLYLTSKEANIPSKWYYDDFVKDIRNTGGAEYEFAKHIFPIIATTDPKLIADGVKKMPEKCTVTHYINGNIPQFKNANFLEIFTERYNIICNKWVDVKELALKYTKENWKDERGYPIEHSESYCGFMEGYNQCLQDNGITVMKPQIVIEMEMNWASDDQKPMLTASGDLMLTIK